MLRFSAVSRIASTGSQLVTSRFVLPPSTAFLNVASKYICSSSSITRFPPQFRRTSIEIRITSPCCLGARFATSNLPLFAPVPATDDPIVQKRISNWLFGCCGLVFGMVVLGGITRLTRSGLSMVHLRTLYGGCM